MSFSRSPGARNQTHVPELSTWGWESQRTAQRGPDPNTWGFLPDVCSGIPKDSAYAPSEETLAIYRVLTGKGTPEDEAIAEKVTERNFYSDPMSIFNMESGRCRYCHTNSNGHNCQNCGAPR